MKRFSIPGMLVRRKTQENSNLQDQED